MADTEELALIEISKKMKELNLGYSKQLENQKQTYDAIRTELHDHFTNLKNMIAKLSHSPITSKITSPSPGPSVQEIDSIDVEDVILMDTIYDEEPSLEKESKPIQVLHQIEASAYAQKSTADLSVKEVKVMVKQSTSSNDKNVAHQVFDQMPLRVTKHEKHLKHLKGWKFKFKRKSLIGFMLGIEQYKIRERKSKTLNSFSSDTHVESMKIRITWKHWRIGKQKQEIGVSLVGVEEKRSSRLCQNIQVWEPGGLWAEKVDWKWLKAFYSDCRAIKLRQKVDDISFHRVAKELAYVFGVLFVKRTVAFPERTSGKRPRDPGRFSKQNWTGEQSDQAWWRFECNHIKVYEAGTWKPECEVRTWEPENESGGNEEKRLEKMILYFTIYFMAACVREKKTAISCQEFDVIGVGVAGLHEKGSRENLGDIHIMLCWKKLDSVFWFAYDAERWIQLGDPPNFGDLHCVMNQVRVWLKMVLFLHCSLILFISKLFRGFYVYQNKNQTSQKRSSFWEFLLRLSHSNLHILVVEKNDTELDNSCCYGSLCGLDFATDFTASTHVDELKIFLDVYVLNLVAEHKFLHISMIIKESPKDASDSDNQEESLIAERFFEENSHITWLFLKLKLRFKAGFWTRYKYLHQLITELQSSPGLVCFTYLLFIWNHALFCGCEVEHISSGTFSMGDAHGLFICCKLHTGDETQGKRLLFLNKIPQHANKNQIAFTAKETWVYDKPMLLQVFHLQRPPELTDLHGHPDFFTTVFVQWKEHPPYQFSQTFSGKFLVFYHP